MYGAGHRSGTGRAAGAPYLSTEVAGGFTGRVIGMYATAGTVRFDWYDYEQMSGSFKTGAGGAA